MYRPHGHAPPSHLRVEEYVVDAEGVELGEVVGVVDGHVAVEAAEEQDGPRREADVVELDAPFRVELLPAVAVRDDVPDAGCNVLPPRRTARQTSNGGIIIIIIIVTSLIVIIVIVYHCHRHHHQQP